MKKITVTQPFLPPLEEFQPYLEEIWKNKHLTNNGPFHQQFEKELAEFLGVQYISLFTNGTLALLTALQALNIKGEVITTPYSFVATTNSLWWNNLKPVFVDIDPKSYNLDPKHIEEAITPNTSAILPVHVYGNPCNVERIREIADEYGLKVIYDAAHAFGNNYKGQSLLNFGDLSILSLHATKVFNTMEGGAIISHDAKMKKRIDILKNFGFVGETKVTAPGINSKMNEMQAALGILQLKYHKENIEKRAKIAQLYKKELTGCKGISTLELYRGTENYNNAYFPIFIDEELFGHNRDTVYEELKNHNIYARRYFYPLISEFATYKGLPSSRSENLPIAHRVASQVICLPIYPDLSEEEVIKICKLIKSYTVNKNI